MNDSVSEGQAHLKFDHDVFISYCSLDRELAKALAAELADRDIDFWFDQFLVGGNIWPALLQEKMKRSRIVAVLWTARSVDRFQVWYEAKYAANEGKLVPIETEHGLDYPSELDELKGINRILALDPYQQADAIADALAQREHVEAVARSPHPDSRDGVQVELSRMPALLPTLFGRQRELGFLDEAWRSEGPCKTNVYVLHGIGGAGKTALALHFVHNLADKDYLGAKRVFYWSFIDESSRPGDVKRDPTALADEFLACALVFFGHDLSGRPIQSREERGRTLARLIGQRRTLLVLDGLEALQSAPLHDKGAIKHGGIRVLIRALADDNPGLLLITTQQPLAELANVREPRCRDCELDRLSVTAGVSYLQHLDVRGPQAEMEAAVNEVSGHALTLTLLGTYLVSACEGDIRSRDTLDLAKLAEGDAETIPEARHAQRIIDAYFHRLGALGHDGAIERMILFLVGLCDRPLEAGAIIALLKPPAIPGLTDAWHALTTQQSRNIQWNNARKRLTALRLLSDTVSLSRRIGSIDAHPLVRRHCRLRTEPAAFAKANERLYDHCLALAGEGPAVTLEQMKPLVDAVGHGCASGRYAETFDEIWLERINRHPHDHLCSVLGEFGLALRALSNFFEQPWEKADTRLSDNQHVTLQQQTFHVLGALGRGREAVELARGTIALAERLKYWNEASAAAVGLADQLLTQGQIAEAVTFAERAVDAADSDKARYLPARVNAYACLAHGFHQKGKSQPAEKLFRLAERLQAQIDKVHPIIYSFGGAAFCELLIVQGRVNEAAARAEKFLQWLDGKASQQRLERALATLILARATHFAWRKARFRENGSRANQPVTDVPLIMLPERLARDGRPTTRHVAVTESLQCPLVAATSSELMERARQLFDDAITQLRASGQQDDLARGLLGRCVYRRDAGLFEECREDLIEAQEIAERGEMKLARVDCDLAWARYVIAMDPGLDDPRNRNLVETVCDRAEQLIKETGYERRQKLVLLVRQALAGLDHVVSSPPPEEGAAEIVLRSPQETGRRYRITVPCGHDDLRRYFDLLSGFFRPKDVDFPPWDFFQHTREINPSSLIIIGDGDNSGLVFGGIELYGMRNNFFDEYLKLDSQVTDADFRPEHVVDVAEAIRQQRLYTAITIHDEQGFFGGKYKTADPDGSREIRDLLIGATSFILKQIYLEHLPEGKELDVYAVGASKGGIAAMAQLGFEHVCDGKGRKDGLPLMRYRATKPQIDATVEKIRSTTLADWRDLDFRLKAMRKA
jgi:hypothetical protein